MKTILLLCLPLLVQAQFSPMAEKPHDLQCSHAKSAERWMHASLDAESLHTYDQLSLTLDLKVEDGDVPVQGTASIELVARESLANIPFNAEGLQVSSVRVNGVSASFTHAADTLFVQRAVAQAETVEASIDYTALPNPDWNDTGFQTGWEQAYTFSEPFGARRWYPCWDQPSDKFDHVTVIVDMPENWSLASNGRLTAFDPHEPGRLVETYEHDQPISTYLVMFAAGNFSRQILTQDDIQYRYYAWPRGDSAQAAYDFERTPQMVTHFSDLFGDYPFAEYGMVMTDIFGGWGAMEHQTFTTYGFNLVDSARTFEGIVAHELAHQWFGDHLSPVDFRNMWLNEGFATYSSVLWTEFDLGEEGLTDAMRTVTNVCVSEERNNPPSYSVHDPHVDRLFGVNVYYKGAWVLHMLRKQILGDSLFYAVMRDYVETFGGGNVDTEDFMNVINEHYEGPDVDWFFDQWVYGLGYPRIEFEPNYDIPGQFMEGRITQTQAGGQYFRFPVVIEFGHDAYTQIDTFWVDDSEHTGFAIGNNITVARLAADQITLLEDITSDSPEPPLELPAEFTVSPAYPNPFNPSVTIPLSLSKRGNFELTLFDITGRRVATIFKGSLSAGEHTLNYQALATLSAGVYLLRASNGEESKTQKILLLK